MTIQRWHRWGIGLVLWTLPALLFTTQNYAAHLQTEHPLGWWRVFRWELPNWYAWALLAPAVVVVARRFRFDSGSVARSLGVHLAASSLAVVAHSVLHIVSIWLLGWNAELWPALWPVLLANVRSGFGASLFVYATIVAVWYAQDYYRACRRRELQGLELEARLARAQLQALKTQMRPHFLFNTLHAISGLMLTDSRGARAMMARLSELLRLSLDSDGVQEVPLHQELDFLRLYLDLQQMRFRDRLTVQLDLSADAMEAMVPKLLLQPLVENALQHGLADRATPGRIEIHTERDRQMVRLQVRDNGPGLPNGGIGLLQERIGVGNTRARLQHLYGSRHRFELTNVAEGGCLVTVEIPLRVSAAVGY